MSRCESLELMNIEIDVNVNTVCCMSNTENGRNPAPIDGSLSHYLHGFIHPRWRGFFHQQYHTMSSA